MNKNNIIILVVVILLILIGIVAFTSSGGPSLEVITPQEEVVAENEADDVVVVTVNSTTTATTTIPAVAPATVKSFTVTGANFSFAPSAMTVKKGDTVRITLKNDEGFHDLKIDEFNKATPKIQAGQTATIEFVADKAGSFEYYCTVGTHRAMGMKGTLTVTP